MAVYTHLSADALSELIGHYDVGELVSAKGIAEGVSNSNWLIETTGKGGTGARFILTMYERRIDIGELPFFLGLLDHLADAGSPVPRTIHDKEGAAYRTIGDKAVALIEFLPGVSVDRPEPAQAHAVGKALAGMHLAVGNFSGARENDLGQASWAQLAADCSEEGLASIDHTLPGIVSSEIEFQAQNWPSDLPRSVIHADLFPDNVLLLGDTVSGLIDFYFACTDVTALDLATTHAAWAFDPTGTTFDASIGKGLVTGYEEVRPLAADERAALPTLARGASLRFILTRAYDWLHTPPDALVSRKDPMDFARRLAFYADAGAEVFAA